MPSVARILAKIGVHNCLTAFNDDASSMLCILVPFKYLNPVVVQMLAFAGWAFNGSYRKRPLQIGADKD